MRLSLVLCVHNFKSVYDNIYMMEELRKYAERKRESKIFHFPVVNGASTNPKSLISSENALKLCRAGARKERFINFDLRTDEDVDLKYYRTPRSNVFIPSLQYNESKFSPMK